MQFNYPQKEDGIYILSKNDIEEIANSILNKYYPQNLEIPLSLNTTELLEEHLGLTIKHKYIGSLDSGILGLIVMKDEAEIPSYDDMYRRTVLEETYGTVLISQQLSGRENAPRRRYTEAHEGSHFILHSEYFNRVSSSTAKRTENWTDCIACRNTELFYRNAPSNKFDWMEWQADTLAAALLMPKEVFRYFGRNVIRDNGVTRGFLISENLSEKRIAREIISEIAKQFNVSYRAAQIRMMHLGLIKKNIF